MMLAAEAGVHPPVFWDLTYRELFAILRAHRRQTLRDQRQSIITGYYAGVIFRAKKAPKLQNLLRGLELERPPPQTPEQLRRTIVGLNRAMGGKVRYVPKGTIRGGK